MFPWPRWPQFQWEDTTISDEYDDLLDESELAEPEEGNFSDDAYPPFPGEVIASVEEPGRNGHDQQHIIVKPIDADFGPFHSWYDLPDKDETGRRPKVKPNTKTGKFQTACSKYIRHADGSAYRRSELVGARAIWQKIAISFGEKQSVDENGVKLFAEDGSKIMEPITSKPTLIPVGALAQPAPEVDFEDDELSLFGAFYHGKTDAEIQSAVGKAFQAGPTRTAILNGKAKKALQAAGVLSKGDDKRYVYANAA